MQQDILQFSSRHLILIKNSESSRKEKKLLFIWIHKYVCINPYNEFSYRYIDSKEGVQIYSLLHDHSTKATTIFTPTEHKSNHQSIEISSKKQTEEYNRFASITSNKTLQRLLSYCSKASQQIQQLSFTSITNLPSSLHQHQQEGVSWLSTLYNHGYNGILADEMGLGKTVQVLSFLNLLQQQQQYLKCIIIVPTSLLLNWEKEIKRWSSNLKYLMIKGTYVEKEECMKEYSMNRNEYSIILTRYDIRKEGDNN